MIRYLWSGILEAYIIGCMVRFDLVDGLTSNALHCLSCMVSSSVVSPIVQFSSACGKRIESSAVSQVPGLMLYPCVPNQCIINRDFCLGSVRRRQSRLASSRVTPRWMQSFPLVSLFLNRARGYSVVSAT